MQSTKLRQDLRQILLAVMLGVVCIGAIAWFQVPQLRQLEAQKQTANLAEIQQSVAAEQMRLRLLQYTPTFGYDNLLADWVFLNFLQYFGDDAARQKTDYRLSPEFFRVVLHHNPYFLQAYTFLSTSGSIYAGQPKESTALMQKALQSLQPNAPQGSYYAWRQLAIDQLLFLADPQAARQSFTTAAEWARIQGDEAVATLSQQTADFLANNPESRYAQIAAWSMVLTSVPDEKTRQTALKQIEALGGQIVTNPDGSVSIQPPAED